MAAVVIIVAPIEEILVIFRQIRLNIKMNVRSAFHTDAKGNNSIQDDLMGVGLVPLNSDGNATNV